ncbi:MAG: hypothetical protein WAM53_09005 [Terrimicrobiaceae bacterium]
MTLIDVTTPMPSDINSPQSPDSQALVLKEQGIEEGFIEKLRSLKYTYRSDIRDRAALEKNFREKFEALNRVRLTESEFQRLLDELITPDVFTAARVIREKNDFTRDDGTPLAYTLVNIKDWCTEGKGQLVITFWKGTEKIGEGGGVWLDLMNIKKMYVRAKGTPETNIDAPWDDYPSLDTGFVSDLNGYEFVKPQDEQKKVLIYVHGIHAPFAGQNASYLGNANVAETVYKRLWHAGYKGRFALYKWPALNPAGFFPVAQDLNLTKVNIGPGNMAKGFRPLLPACPANTSVTC